MNKGLIVAISLVVFSSSVVAATAQQSIDFSTANKITAVDDSVNGSLGSKSLEIPLSFKQFDANIGVLTGVTSTLNITGGKLTLKSTGTGSRSNNPAMTSNGMILANATLPSLQLGTPSKTLNFSCSGDSGSTRCFDSDGAWKNSTATATLTTLSSSSSATTDGLNSYVGPTSLTSTVTVTNTASLTKADKISNPKATLEVAGLTGTQSLEYTYLNHANASFTSGSDTNSLNKDVSGGVFNFSVYNHGTVDTADLASGSFTCTAGDCGAFKFTSNSFNNVSASNSFINYGSIEVAGTAASGAYNATFALVFSDMHAGAASYTLKDNSLFLTVSASVAPVSAVPEPETYAMLLAGLSVVGLKIRRRRSI
jgi:hypothetical protein